MNRPQTPVKGIICGNYGNEAAIDITNKYESAANAKMMGKPRGPP